MLSWEYPPRIVGGISRVVHDLAQTLGNMGHEIHVVTCREGDSPEYEKDENVFVYRVNPYDVEPITFIDWVTQLNFSLAEKAISLFKSGLNFDIVHLHDWLVAYAGKMVRNLYPEARQICTIHATEQGRNSGIHNHVQRYISNVETRMGRNVDKVIVNSNFMKYEVMRNFSLPEQNIHVIPNGIDINKFSNYSRNAIFRRSFAFDNEKIVLFVGRLVNEKGIHTLMEAIPKVLCCSNNAKFIIAGKGPEQENLRRRACELGLGDKVYLTGYINDEDLMALYKCSDIAVFPSLYEPFGIVALEGMVANIQVIVSNAGGLEEIVQDGYNGLKFPTGRSDLLSDCIIDLLYNFQKCEVLKQNAIKTVKENYGWEGIAKKTLNAYNSCTCKI